MKCIRGALGISKAHAGMSLCGQKMQFLNDSQMAGAYSRTSYPYKQRAHEHMILLEPDRDLSRRFSAASKLLAAPYVHLGYQVDNTESLLLAVPSLPLPPTLG